MADRDMADDEIRPEGAPSARTRPGGRGRARPLLALAAVLPLAAAVGIVATSTPSELAAVPRAESRSAPGPAPLWCPGPMQVEDSALDVGGDEELAITPPSPAVELGALALEPESSLLFGSVEGSQTQQQDDGTVRAPQITVEDTEGETLPGDTQAQDLGAAVHEASGIESGSLLTAATTEDRRPVADAVQTTMTGAGDFRSLSVTRCAQPATEASFLGMSTESGDSSELVLRNPSTRPATASVQLWTQEGPAEMAGRSQVVLAAGAEERILLESVAAGHEVVGVTTTVMGAPLAMHVQTTRRDGLAPAGAEILEPLPQPERRSVMPGVQVADIAPVAVLANAHGSATTATIRVLGAEGEIPAATHEEVPIPAGAVVPVPLEGLESGQYTVEVDAESPVHAVTRSAMRGADLPGETIAAPVDGTLSAPAPTLGNSAVTASPSGGAEGLLGLSATADTSVTVIPIAADGSAGAPHAQDLPAEVTTTIAAAELAVAGDPAAGLVLVPEEPGTVHASWLELRDDGADGVLLSALPVQTAAGGEDALTVVLAD